MLLKGKILIISGIVLLLLSLYGKDPLIKEAKNYTDNVIKKTLTAYVVIRGINAGVSVIKESEINLPIVSIAAGQVLDPIDDITERTSFILMIAFISLGIQEIFLEFFPNLFLYFLGILLIILGILYILKIKIPKFLLSLTLAFLIIRFFIPILMISTEIVYNNYIKPAINEKVTYLNDWNKKLELKENLETSQINQINKETEKKENIFSYFKEKIKSFKTSICKKIDNVENKIKKIKKLTNEIKEKSDKIVESILYLALYFVFQTIIIPISILWITLWSIKYIFISFQQG